MSKELDAAVDAAKEFIRSAERYKKAEKEGDMNGGLFPMREYRALKFESKQLIQTLNDWRRSE